MNNSIYKNGFIIKGCIDNEYTQSDDIYQGIGKFVSWPLEWQEDFTSKKLSSEAYDRWFGYTYADGDVSLDVIPEREFLIQYLTHCKILGIETRILMIETHKPYPINNVEVKNIQVLGFDYGGAGCNYSLLNMDTAYLEGDYKVFKCVAEKLNKFGLLDD